MALNIVVLVKVVPKPSEVKMDPETNTLDRRGAESIINPPDKNAVELAVSLKDTFGGKVTLVTMAPPFVDDFLRLMLAMGADDAIILSDRKFAMADSYPTCLVLSEGIKKIGDVDLVLTGVESADGGTGNVPPGVAEFLGYSQATYAEDVDYDGENDRFIVERSSTSGTELIGIPRPAVVSIELGANSPRFPRFEIKNELDKNFKVTIWDNSVLELPEDRIGLTGSYTLVEKMIEPPSRDRKHEKITGSPREIAEKLADIILEQL